MKRKHNNLRGFDVDSKTQTYFIKEGDITYSMKFEMHVHIKRYFSFTGNHTVAQWYADLSKEDRAKVKREGVPPKEDDGFYPD